MITERVKNTIIYNRLIEQGGHIVVGLSGGPDSVCLFHILCRLRGELNFSISAVHINHGLRPGAAEEDQKYAETICAEYGVNCKSFTFDVNRIAAEQGISSEDAGRRVRYQSFFETAAQIAAETGTSVRVAVAQNRNDQAETVLMRILRGTGTEGLCGIEYLREEKGKGVVIRPLLDLSREEIEVYCRENGLEPRIDLTNLEPIYTRNKIRLELLPYLSEHFNQNVTGALNRLSKIAKEDKVYFSRKVRELMEAHFVIKEPLRASFPLDILRMELPAMRHRLILRIFEEIGLPADITSAHLEQADQLITGGRTSARTNFSLGYVMAISYTTVEFYRDCGEEAVRFEYEINLEGNTEIPELNARIGVKIFGRHDWVSLEGKKRLFENKNVCMLNLDKIAKESRSPVLRTRQEGDYIIPLGMKGRKKLQDFFVDEKYPKESRGRMPLLCLGQEVIWIPGGRISENYKVDDQTERIILLEYSAKL